MAHAFDVNMPAAPARDVGDAAKIRDEITRLSQRLVRARASYEGDLARGFAEIPLEMQLATIETYSAKLEELDERLRLAEGEPPPQQVVPEQPSHAATTTVEPQAPEPQPVDAAPPVAWAPLPVPETIPLPHRARGAQPEPALVPQPAPVPPPVPVAQPVPQPVLQPQAPVPQHQAPPPPQPAPAAVPQPYRPAPTGPGIANPDGTPLVIDSGLIRTEESAIGEYVRIAAEMRWEATYRPSMVAEHAEVCDVILGALAHKHGVTVEEEREALARQVDARFRRDYG